MIVWTLHLHPSVTTYVYSLRPNSKAISDGIKAIAAEAQPWINDRVVAHREHRYERFVSGYWVTYHVNEAEKIIRVLRIEPNI